METNQTPSVAVPAKRNYKVLWIMIFLFALPYVAAMYVYLNRDELEIGKQSNYGNLISPAKKLPAVSMTTINGDAASFDDAEIKGKWLMLTISSASCETACMDNMYKMRQLRKAAAENSLRLQRIFLLSDNQNMETLQNRLQEYGCMKTQIHDTECLKIMRYDAATSDTLFAFFKMEGQAVNDGIYIIDPLGQYMMYYPPDADPRKMLKDIERLLKTSQIG